MTKDKTFVLNLIPLPEGEFGPEEARDWMKSDLPDRISAVQHTPEKNKPGSADFHYFIKKDTATMATACSEAIASGKPVEFGRGLGGGTRRGTRSQLASRRGAGVRGAPGRGGGGAGVREVGGSAGGEG
jgi:hypothetical protein